jgi:hypothetical protein
MKVALTPLMKKILSDKTASKQLRESLIGLSKEIEVDGRKYELEYVGQ